VDDRILPAQHIPHNKFCVLKKSGTAVAVLTGSTNWTVTGLCTQTNNGLLIESAAVAAQYADYWDQLRKIPAPVAKTARGRERISGSGTRRATSA